MSKSKINGLAKNVDCGNVNEIVHVYKGNSNESKNSKNRDDLLLVNPKSHENDYGNRSIEVGPESAPIACETRKINRNTETNIFDKSSSNFQSSLVDSDKNLSIYEKYSEQISSEIMESILRKNCFVHEDLQNNFEMENRKNEDMENAKEKFKRSKLGNIKHTEEHEQKQNPEDYEIKSYVDIAGKKNLNAHNLDTSGEDCVKSENAWPDIYPYEKTEEIPVKELKSLELKGLYTKYLKLELPNEFIVIKVTSGSNVLVNAAKYKETGSKQILRENNSLYNYNPKKIKDDVAVSKLILSDRRCQGENSYTNTCALLEDTDIEEKKSSLPSGKILIDSFEDSASGNYLHVSETMDDIVDVESFSEDVDYKIDSVTSIISECNDRKDSGKQVPKRKECFKKNTYEVEEVDCAPTRIRILIPFPELTKDTTNVPSMYSGSKFSIRNFFRNKDLDSNSQQSKETLRDKKQNVISESEKGDL